MAVTTPVGVVIHTGDFKVDPTPTDNELFDLHTLADYGKRGVLLLLSDSTNADGRGIPIPNAPCVRAWKTFSIAPKTVCSSRVSARPFIACSRSSISRTSSAAKSRWSGAA